MSRILSSLKKVHTRAIARQELGMLSSRQLRDINLERVTVINDPIYRSRMWNAH
ncbi:MAG: hypothetical protein GDA49_12445 [Rhodospirillales bacterium]|nr:hypothetical protein [Rhodospirillales bacterium]